jgi:23S rRNA (pseudouridine1915-N3)-methyltransferase
MLHVTIFTIGKCKERWLDEALAEFYKRLTGQISITIELARDDAHLEQMVKKHQRAVLLDPKGKEVTSEEFTSFFYREIEQGGSHLAFVIGGPDGLTKSIKEGGYPMISLSKMTLTHQMVRLLLVEQVYRAYEINRGTGYHK